MELRFFCFRFSTSCTLHPASFDLRNLQSDADAAVLQPSRVQSFELLNHVFAKLTVASPFFKAFPTEVLFFVFLPIIRWASLAAQIA